MLRAEIARADEAAARRAAGRPKLDAVRSRDIAEERRTPSAPAATSRRRNAEAARGGQYEAMYADRPGGGEIEDNAFSDAARCWPSAARASSATETGRLWHLCQQSVHVRGRRADRSVAYSPGGDRLAGRLMIVRIVALAGETPPIAIAHGGLSTPWRSPIRANRRPGGDDRVACGCRQRALGVMAGHGDAVVSFDFARRSMGPERFLRWHGENLGRGDWTRLSVLGAQLVVWQAAFARRIQISPPVRTAARIVRSVSIGRGSNANRRPN